MILGRLEEMMIYRKKTIKSGKNYFPSFEAIQKIVFDKRSSRIEKPETLKKINEHMNLLKGPIEYLKSEYKAK